MKVIFVGCFCFVVFATCFIADVGFNVGDYAIFNFLTPYKIKRDDKSDNLSKRGLMLWVPLMAVKLSQQCLHTCNDIFPDRGKRERMRGLEE